MKNLKTDEIRRTYIDYFAKRDHKVVGSDSLVPHNDPTLLFSGAGMNQFKEYFLGLKKDMKRATSSQKCMRTGDLDNVGRTAYHHSFFEMLGNFSFGDYFKEEAITWAWEFLTEVLEIPKEKLRISIHESDDEAYEIWLKKIKVREDHLYRLGDDSNYWPANAPKDGPNGPCGPCSEIYYDLGADSAAPGDDENDLDSGRYSEIWNLVFTQYDRQSDGSLKPLKNKNIDTGMGLERLACVLQGKKNNFEIDIFEPIHEAIQKALDEEPKGETLAAFYAIADHVRAAVFAMSDGVIPSNEGRGYVIRKLIRRALWQAHQVKPGKKVEAPFLYKVVPGVVKAMKGGYPELKDSEKSIASTLKGEEERFLATLETGLKRLQVQLKKMKSDKTKALSSKFVFELYDTYGFPDELTKIIAEEEGVEIDQAGFDEEMESQRKRAKQSSQMADSIFVSTELEKKVLAMPDTNFMGWDCLEAAGEVLMAEISEGKGVVVLDTTPFYAESGGQVGDKGNLSAKDFNAKVIDTQKKDKVILHYIEIEKGSIKTGAKVKAVVDIDLRERTMRNHTATHILHAALREILGTQVRQLGSLVSPDKLRFDYSYPNALTQEQLRKVEDSVNQQILKNTRLIKEEKSIDQAKKEGAIAFFGEKYGKKVRIVTVPGFSKELCGGTHCEGTGQIGIFVIISDSSVASGTRRIEALTGEGALNYVRQLRAQVNELAQDLKTTPAQLGERISKMRDSMKKMEKDMKSGSSSKINADQILQEAKSAGALKFASYKNQDIQVPDLRNLSDALRSKGSKTVYFLGTSNEEKIHFLLGMSHDLLKSKLDLRELMKDISPFLGASGGGRRDLVQGGGRNEGQLDQKWMNIVNSATAYLEIQK